jgi:hypothetical protein
MIINGMIGALDRIGIARIVRIVMAQFYQCAAINWLRGPVYYRWRTMENLG